MCNSHLNLQCNLWLQLEHMAGHILGPLSLYERGNKYVLMFMMFLQFGSQDEALGDIQHLFADSKELNPNLRWWCQVTHPHTADEGADPRGPSDRATL